MSWAEYSQRTGRFTIWQIDDGGVNRAVYECQAYSGRGVGLNNPTKYRERGIGPIPIGCYDVHGPIRHERMGPVAFRLDPKPWNDMAGRSGFMLHGDNSKRNRSASSGCIILDRPHRLKIAEYGVRTLLVDR